MDDLNAELAMAELERTWAARRGELSQRLDASVQGAIASVLDAAAQLRQAMEQDAAQALERLRRERVAVAREVASLRAEQDGLGGEIAAARRRAEQDAEALRRAAEQEAAEVRRSAQSERDALLRDAEQRRVELNEEIARLEQQLVQVSSGIQALLQEQIGRVRAGLPGGEQIFSIAAGVPPGPAAAPSPAATAEPRAPAPARPPAPAGRPEPPPGPAGGPWPERPAHGPASGRSSQPPFGAAAPPAAASGPPAGQAFAPSATPPTWPGGDRASGSARPTSGVAAAESVAVDPTASPGPTPAAGAAALASTAAGLEILDEGELFDLAVSQAGESTIDQTAAELELDAPLAPLTSDEDELAALGLDEPVDAAAPADDDLADLRLDAEGAALDTDLTLDDDLALDEGAGLDVDPALEDGAGQDDDLTLDDGAGLADDRAEAHALDAELAALDAELALDPMEQPVVGQPEEEETVRSTAADARSALLASLAGLGLADAGAHSGFDEPEVAGPPARGAPAARGAERPPASGAGRGEPAGGNASPAPRSSGEPAARPSRPAAGGTVRVEVAVTGTPSFARALELQRGIQRTDGVRQVQALQFERGTLVLSVEHDAALDLADAMLALPNNLELIDRSESRVELRFPAAR
jgi:hypothetical protein